MKRTTRPCCDEPTCPRDEVSQLLEPDNPISQRVRTAACKVAALCVGMPQETLRQCFSRLFDAPPECALADNFVTAYELERAALAGNSEVQNDDPAGRCASRQARNAAAQSDDATPTFDGDMDCSAARSMKERPSADGEQICSDLVSLSLSTGQTVTGVLEKISPSGCLVTLEEPIAGASVVTLQCVECPQGDAHCIQCAMTGTVTSQESDPPLGILAAIEFTEATWCEERWKPRHLTKDSDLS